MSNDFRNRTSKRPLGRPPELNSDGTRIREPRFRGHTFASLGLNIEAAERGELDKLIPEKYWQCVDEYGLPSNYHELARLAAIPLIGGHFKYGPKQYIMRAKRAFKIRTKHKQFVNIATSVKIFEADKRLSVERLKAAERDVAKELGEFRLKVAEATASLADLSNLCKSGHRMILEGFVLNKPVQVGDEQVHIDPDTFNASSRVVFSHISKLGPAALDPESVQEAEETVFGELLETRRRVADTQGDPVLPEPGEQ